VIGAPTQSFLETSSKDAGFRAAAGFGLEL